MGTRELTTDDGAQSEQNTKAIGAQIPKETKSEIKLEAAKRSMEGEDIKQSDLVRLALSEYLDIPLDELEP